MVEREAETLLSYSYEGQEQLIQPSAPPISLLEEGAEEPADGQAKGLHPIETQSCWRAALHGLLPGAAFGGVVALCRARNLGLKMVQILPAIAFSTLKCSLAGGLFLGVEQKLRKSRGVHDIINSMLAGGSAVVWVVALNVVRPFIYSDRLLYVLNSKVQPKSGIQNFLTMLALGSTFGGLAHVLKESYQGTEPLSPQSETPSNGYIEGDHCQMESNSETELDKP